MGKVRHFQKEKCVTVHFSCNHFQVKLFQETFCPPPLFTSNLFVYPTNGQPILKPSQLYIYLVHSSDQPVEDSKTRMLSTVVLTAAFCLLISQIDIRLLVFRWGRITVHWGRKEETTPEEKLYSFEPSMRILLSPCRCQKCLESKSIWTPCVSSTNNGSALRDSNFTAFIVVGSQSSSRGKLST